ncbi:MAG: hypothetical protein ACKPGI_19285 [Verrucomicrobiota bacterium]
MRNLIRLDAPNRRARGNRRESKGMRDWVAERLGLSDSDTVSVNEVACADPGCPDVETVVVVFRAGNPPLRLRVGKRLAEVTLADFDALI